MISSKNPGNVVPLRKTKRSGEKTERELVAEILDRFERWWPRQSAEVKRGIRTLVRVQTESDQILSFRSPAIEILEHLNRRRPAGCRGFKPTHTNLRLICARLGEGFTVPELKAMVAIKARQAENGEFDPRWLRPATLFNALKCSQYLGELPEKSDG